MRPHTNITFSRFLTFALLGIALCGTPAAGGQSAASADNLPPANEIQSRLQSLRRSVENSTDIKSILERYARFIEQYKDSPAARDAQADAAAWRDRLEKKMVKVGPRWVTPAEREELKLHARTLADQAREAMLKTRKQEGESLVQKALEEDAGNVLASYLNGVLQFDQNQPQQAKKSFELVATAAPREGANLNNLAVVQWNLKQAAIALKVYEQAMNALPVNKEILHNVAEAVHALPPGQRTTQVAKSAIRVWETQQAQLATKMAKEGLVAWGSTWIDKDQSVKLAALEKDIEQRVAVLSADYDKSQKSVDEIDGSMENNTRLMGNMERASNYRDLKGFQIQKPLPAKYFELQKQNQQFTQDRQALAAKQAEDREKAAKAVAEMPIQKYTGTQRIFGAENAPAQPVLAATRAATKPV